MQSERDPKREESSASSSEEKPMKCCIQCGGRLWGEQLTCSVCRLGMKALAREDVDVADEIDAEFGDVPCTAKVPPCVHGAYNFDGSCCTCGAPEREAAGQSAASRRATHRGTARRDGPLRYARLLQGHARASRGGPSASDQLHDERGGMVCDICGHLEPRTSQTTDVAWNDAIEAAARRCEVVADHMGPRFCADQIRKLRRTTHPGGDK